MSEIGPDIAAGAPDVLEGAPPPPIDFRSLEVFYWVVKLGGFGRAAERLRMTQPAVSARIGQAEHGFRARLLDRSSHRAPVPTLKGLELFHYAERMLALRTEMLTRLGHAGEVSGVLRVGVAETLVHTLLGALVRRLHALHPGVTPEIMVDTSPNMQAALLAGEIDLALMLGPLGAPGVQSVPLGEHELVWAASPDLPIGEGRLGLRDLARWPILSYARGTAPHERLAELFARGGPAADAALRQCLAQFHAAHGARRHRDRGLAARRDHTGARRGRAAPARRRPAARTARLHGLLPRQPHRRPGPHRGGTRRVHRAGRIGRRSKLPTAGQRECAPPLVRRDSTDMRQHVCRRV